MSRLPRFDATAALNEIRSPTPAKVAKAAKLTPESENFRDFRNFRSPPPEFDESSEDRRAWTADLCRAVFRWLSVHPPDVWTAARIGERIAPLWRHLETHLEDYERTGEPGDCRAAVYAANAVAAEAGRIARELFEERR